MIISCVSSRIYFITVTKNEVEVDLDAEQIKLPPYSLTRVQILCQETEQALADNDQKLAVLAEKEQPSLQAALKEVNTEIEFSQVILNTQATAGRKTMLLQGWAPLKKECAWLDEQHIYYEITNPTTGTIIVPYY